jgi:adenine/guanine phosphoribosyltransferase-like PRPP-binding protein
MRELTEMLLQVDNFFNEGATVIDGMSVPCKPIYIEYLYLYPGIFKKVVSIIKDEIQKYEPNMLLAVESAILPISTAVAQQLDLPLCIVRKPTHTPHEPGEPLYFLNKEHIKDVSGRSILIDDAIWSGKTINYVLDLFMKDAIAIPRMFFIFDFMELKGGGEYIPQKYQQYMAKRISLISYREFLEVSKEKGYISDLAYNESKKMFIK